MEKGDNSDSCNDDESPGVIWVGWRECTAKRRNDSQGCEKWVEAEIQLSKNKCKNYLESPIRVMFDKSINSNFVVAVFPV